MIKKITTDLLFDCEKKAVSGLEQSVLLINFFDIDRMETQINNDRTEIQKLVLKGGLSGFMIKGIKRIFSGGQKSAIRKNSINRFEQNIELRIFHLDANTLFQLDKLSGGVFVAIVHTKNKQFEILGYEAGLVLDNVQRDYNSNNSNFSISLKSSDAKEPKPLFLWNEGDYSQMLKRFERRLSTHRIFDDSFDLTFE